MCQPRRELSSPIACRRHPAGVSNVRSIPRQQCRGQIETESLDWVDKRPSSVASCPLLDNVPGLRASVERRGRPAEAQGADDHQLTTDERQLATGH